jgi:hypothetical protein
MQQQQQRQQQQASQPAAAGVSSMLGSAGSWLTAAGRWATGSSRADSEQQGIAGSSSSGSTATGLPNGSCITGSCPLCQREAREQAAEAAPATCSSQQFAHDPFAWRRLLWGLLGRRRPTARAWFVQHYGMCPHCPSRELWQLISRTLRSYLWVPPDTDAVQWQLSAPPVATHVGASRGQQLLQYARALNRAFLEVRK